jgi:hypothetical protein
VRVKAQGLLNAAKWVEENHGREGLRDVLQRCTPATRDRYTAVIAIDWHPVEELVDFVGAAETTFGSPGRTHIAEQIGAEGAKANMRSTLVRLVSWVTHPEFLMSRVAAMWNQFNDEGSMHLLKVDERGAQMELRDMTFVNPLFCALITGWCREVGIAIQTVSPVAKHIECRTRGETRCLWEIRYAAKGPNAEKKGGVV